jgi:DNA-binding response OmpR family regulator
VLVRVVEDHPDIAELLRLELTHAGFDVDSWCSNFVALVDIDIWTGVDAAVFDLMLGEGELTGGDLVLFVAEHAPHVRRVILTASSEAHLTPAMREAAHVVMDKPTGIGKLSEAIRGGR